MPEEIKEHLNKDVIEQHLARNGLECPICGLSLEKGHAYFTSYDAYRCPVHKDYLFCAKHAVAIPSDIRYGKISKEFQPGPHRKRVKVISQKRKRMGKDVEIEMEFTPEFFEEIEEARKYTKETFNEFVNSAITAFLEKHKSSKK